MQEPKAGRRIVSRGRYAVNVGRKIVLSLIGVATLVIGILSILGIWIGLSPLIIRFNSWETFGVIAVVALMGGGAALLLYFGVSTLQEVKQTDLGLLLTRANTADLPANDSLVRASQEPAQAQEGVLLRAASGEAQAGQEGQLLRASRGE